MAYRIVWSSKAVEDVDAIATYIARDSPSYA
ncbi:MAG: type II toxin-antitoxin system RelE/ParE family toxin, partial [Microcystaceae cyanobacterium]